MYDVQEGDVLVARNMGAYTTVTASEFNGFPKAKKVYEMC
jgi:diaminopimelate decarboxylase